MAKLYATSPEGTTKSMDIFFDEYVNSGSNENGWRKYTLLSNGFFIYGSDARPGNDVVLPVASYCVILLTPYARYSNKVVESASSVICYPYIYTIDDDYTKPITSFTVKCKGTNITNMLIFTIVIGNLKYT